jgi:hypothetical protein
MESFISAIPLEASPAAPSEAHVHEGSATVLQYFIRLREEPVDRQQYQRGSRNP